MVSTEDVGDSPEQKEFRDSVQRFLAAKAKPRQQAGPFNVTFHTDPEAARQEFEEGRAWQATRYEAGMAGFSYPKEYGGQGGRAWHEQIYNEEARNYGSSSGFLASSIAMLGPTLMAHGTEEQKSTIIPRLLSAEDTWCQLFSEPGAGSDLASLGCRAIRDGDEFVVTGQKVWNSAAQWCDHGFLLVRTNPDVPKHRGITMLLIDMRWPGVEARPLVQATGAAHFNEVFLTEVRVPVANVVGDIDGGWAAARTLLGNEAAMIGSSDIRPFDTLLELSNVYGRREDPIIRQQLADYYSRQQILGMLSERIMSAVRERRRPPVEPALLKLYVTDNRARSAQIAAAIAGAAGTLSDDVPTKWVAAEIIGRFSLSIAGGTTEVQKNNLAERTLGLPREPAGDRDTAWKDLLRN